MQAALPGVPDIEFDDGTVGFGAYNGYPQIFHENIYNYVDLISISHGKHSLKGRGGDSAEHREQQLGRGPTVLHLLRPAVLRH